MKTKIILVTIMLMAAPAVCFAVTVPPLPVEKADAAPGSEAPKPSDRDELKEQLASLRAVLNPETEQVETSGVVVADKALTVLETLITQIAGTVEKMAPDVFRIMYRQQIAKAFGDLIIPWLLFVVCIIYMVAVRRAWKREEYVEYDLDSICRLLLTSALPMCLAIIAGIVGLCALADSIRYLYNPEYYAIRDLIGVLMGNAQM